MKSLFETAINSHDREGDQQLFKQEIDLMANEKLFIDTIGKVMVDALDYLSYIMTFIDEQRIIYESTIEDVIKASMVDFKQVGRKRHKQE